MDVPNAAPPEGEPQHVERVKLVQQKLVLLLHAINCQRRDAAHINVDRVCNLPHCSTLKQVLRHMEICQAGRNCPVPHCSSTRHILQHWSECRKTNCSVCVQLNRQEDLLPIEWHRSITDSQRSNLVELLMNTISESQGYRMQDLVEGGEMEKEIYRTANTLSEYYRMLAAKKWELEMAIKERWMTQSE